MRANYAVLRSPVVIRFVRTKFANLVPRKTRARFRILFDTRAERIGTRAFSNAAFSSFLACARCFYARIVIANSLSPIVIAGTSKRLDKNDFSRAAIDR